MHTHLFMSFLCTDPFYHYEIPFYPEIYLNPVSNISTSHIGNPFLSSLVLACLIFFHLFTLTSVFYTSATFLVDSVGCSCDLILIETICLLLTVGWPKSYNQPDIISLSWG